MKIRNLLAAAGGILALAAGAHADTLLNYSFDPGTTFDFGGGNYYLATGGFTYDSTTSAISNVTYTATGPFGTFSFADATVNSPTDVTFVNDGSGDEDEYFFAQSLALGGTDAITGGAYPGYPITATGSVSTGAVPEPASWALMLVGLGALGATLRTRRRTALAS
jgi:hypothetical protein